MSSGGMNIAQAGLVEPLLSTHVRGYRNSQFVAVKIAPLVAIPNRSMRVVRFGKEDFRRIQTRRAPGGATARVQFGYASDPVSLPQDSLAAPVPVETAQEAQKIPGFDLARIHVDRVMNTFGLGREIDVATKVRNPATYDASNKVTLSGTSKWSDEESNPKADVDAARDVIRRRIGQRPNVLTLGPAVFGALTRHPKIKEQFKYTSADSITADMLARYFEVAEVVVGDAVYLPDTATDDAVASDVWGNDAVLAYVNRAGDYMSPSFGYLYQLQGYPLVETPYYDPNTKSWVYTVTNEEQHYITGADAGFLIKDAA